MSKDSRETYLTAHEVLSRYPALRNDFSFDETTINKLASHHVLWGTYESGKRMWLIQEQSVIHFIQYLNESLSRRHIPNKD